MRPIPLPDETVKAGLAAGWKNQVISAPDGDLTSDSIRPVDALVGIVMTDEDGPALYFNVLIQIEDDDLEQLAKHGRFWISFNGSVVPFSLSVFNPDDEGDADAPDE